MNECGLLHETDPSLPSPRLKANLYDNCESSLPLEFNFVDDASSTSLEEAFDPPLTSSTPIYITISDLALIACPHPLVQCTRLEMGELSKSYANVIEDDLLD